MAVYDYSKIPAAKQPVALCKQYDSGGISWDAAIRLGYRLGFDFQTAYITRRG